MLQLVDESLALVFLAPLAGAVLLFALARGPLFWARVGLGLALQAIALVVTVLLSAHILERGGFAFADIKGWVGVRIEGADPWGLVPSVLAPGQIPLLAAVEVAGLLAFWLLVPASKKRGSTGPLAAVLAATAAVALLVVARRIDAVCAGFSLASVAGFALLVSFEPRRVDVEGAVRAFLLHRAGDALLLIAFLVVAASLNASSLEGIVTTAPALDPWLRATAGPLQAFAAREGWELVAALAALAVATRLALVPLLPLVRDASGAPGPAVGLVHGVCFVGAGLITLDRLAAFFWLAPEIMSALGVAAAVSAVFAAIFALAARDVVRIDINLLCGFGALAAVAFAGADLATAVLASALLILAAVPLCSTSGVIVERTGRADPLTLGGLEKLMPRTHTGRLLATGALVGPVFTGSFLVAHVVAACLFAPWLGQTISTIVVVAAVLLALAAFRPLHLVFTGKAPREPIVDVKDAPLSTTIPPLVTALPLLGVGLLHIPEGVLRALPVETTYTSPGAALLLPERVVLQPVRVHVLPAFTTPSMGPGTVAALALGALLVGWLVSTLLYRGGPSRLHRALFGGPRVQRLVDITAQVAGRESQVARAAGEGAARLSRLIATNLAPGVLDTLLRRIPALVGVIMGAVIRFIANGSAQRGLVITLLVLAGLLVWWGRA
jgi:NADH:ubiquinone oxidoreductase subunit 5 (subunit L)/multisubunit Na+/H+ antiporter MnhA subunit